ncbi:DUF397 domain-containing protein [Streptomyces globosus]|uniref:DUF397 domain-containing protein n=1 Tax=Streptomyces globosus TaxID=68209 RepID=UPI003805C0BB
MGPWTSIAGNWIPARRKAMASASRASSASIIFRRTVGDICRSGPMSCTPSGFTAEARCEVRRLGGRACSGHYEHGPGTGRQSRRQRLLPVPTAQVPHVPRKVAPTYSNPDGGQCLEVADGVPGFVPVRDSKNSHGQALVFPTAEWARFVAAVRRGDFSA